MNSTVYPQNVIDRLTRNQEMVFHKLLGTKEGENISIVKELSKTINPAKGWFHSELTYKEILLKIASHHKIPITEQTEIKKLEEEILLFKFNENYNNLSAENQEKFKNEIEKFGEHQNIDNSQMGSLGAIGALTIANASGMGMYIMASTVVGGLSGILGITLPFAFYTGMSSFLAVITGPVGWTLGLGYVVYSLRNENLDSISKKFTNTLKATKNFFTGNYDLATVLVLQICSNRILINEEPTRKIKELSQTILEHQKTKSAIKEKADMVEQQLARLREEKRKIDFELDAVSSQLATEERAIAVWKSKLL